MSCMSKECYFVVPNIFFLCWQLLIDITAQIHSFHASELIGTDNNPVEQCCYCSLSDIITFYNVCMHTYMKESTKKEIIKNKNKKLWPWGKCEIWILNVLDINGNGSQALSQIYCTDISRFFSFIYLFFFTFHRHID